MNRALVSGVFRLCPCSPTATGGVEWGVVRGREGKAGRGVLLPVPAAIHSYLLCAWEGGGEQEYTENLDGTTPTLPLGHELRMAGHACATCTVHAVSTYGGLGHVSALEG